MTYTGDQLRAQLALRSPLGAPPAKIDSRTKEGKRWKGYLLKEAMAWREQGYTLTEIGAAIGVGPSTLGMWFIVAGRSDLWYRDAARRSASGICHACGAALPSSGPGRRRKYCDEECRRVAFGEITAIRVDQQRQEAMDRRERITTIRREYRRRRAAGEHLPWHILRNEPVLTVEQKAALHELVEQQQRDGDKIGRRPWLVSADATWSGHEADSSGEWTLLETLNLVDDRASSEIEAMMLSNGSDGMPARALKPWPWRVRRPVRETRAAA